MPKTSSKHELHRSFSLAEADLSGQTTHSTEDSTCPAMTAAAQTLHSQPIPRRSLFQELFTDLAHDSFSVEYTGKAGHQLRVVSFTEALRSVLPGKTERKLSDENPC